MVDEEQTPKLFGWADRFMSHVAVANVFPEAGKFLKVVMKIQARARASSKFKLRVAVLKIIFRISGENKPSSTIIKNKCSKYI